MTDKIIDLHPKPRRATVTHTVPGPADIMSAIRQAELRHALEDLERATAACKTATEAVKTLLRDYAK